MSVSSAATAWFAGRFSSNWDRRSRRVGNRCLGLDRTGTSRRQWLFIEGASYCQRSFGEDVGVDHCGSHIAMAEKILDGANVVPQFQESGGEGVPESMVDLADLTVKDLVVEEGDGIEGLVLGGCGGLRWRQPGREVWLAAFRSPPSHIVSSLPLSPAMLRCRSSAQHAQGEGYAHIKYSQLVVFPESITA
jgi:hypothetical protein